MVAGLGENVDPEAAIRAILGSYPFSVGLLREFLQNSDDAKATKQIFLLDKRHHGTTELLDPSFSEYQGPALLAFNDAVFTDEDWKAIKNIHRSSKKSDPSKIGKYGIGFRSCYHITDAPQILSGSMLAIGEEKFNPYLDARCGDHLESFSGINSCKIDSVQGTIIRLPLRTQASEISSKTVTPNEIAELLDDFIREEIDICLLFLQNLTSVEVYEISELGSLSCLASSIMSKETGITSNLYTASKARINVTRLDGFDKEVLWHVLHFEFPESRATSLLENRLGGTFDKELTRHKLLPNLGIAAPLDLISTPFNTGRLFTYLPLPLKTGFPIHIHALFALTSSRQNLRNVGDIGTVKKSDDRVLIEWNKILFDVFIPEAWVEFIGLLAQESGPSDVFQAWPPFQPVSFCGDNQYWQHLPSNFLELVSLSPKALWPSCSPFHQAPSSMKPLESVVIAAAEVSEQVIIALAIAGLSITRPPPYIVDLLDDLLRTTNHRKISFLSKEVAHKELKIRFQELMQMQVAHPDKLMTILSYLLSSEDIRFVIDLPLFPTLDGNLVALSNSPTTATFTLLEKNEFEIFASCASDTIALHQLPPNVAAVLRKLPSGFNIEALDIRKVIGYIQRCSPSLGLESTSCTLSSSTVEWLSKFWIWMGSQNIQSVQILKTHDLPLLPSRTKIKTTRSTLFSYQDNQLSVVSALEQLNVSFLHPDVMPGAKRFLTSFQLLKNVNDIHDLLLCVDALQGQILDLSTGSSILSHFQRYAPITSASFQDGHRLTLQRLPLYQVVQPRHERAVGTITLQGIFYKVNVLAIPGNSAIVPAVDGTTFIASDTAPSTQSILSYLGPDVSVVSECDFLPFIARHFSAQSSILQAAFVHHLAMNRHEYPSQVVTPVIDTLKRYSFVVVTDQKGTLKSPESLVDPQSALSHLFPKVNNRIPRSIGQLEKQLVEDLRSLGLLQDHLTTDILEDRITYISCHLSFPETLAISKNLLAAIEREPYLELSGCGRLLTAKWLPSESGILGQAECRDRESKEELFDEVLSIVKVHVPSRLRHVFRWDEPLPLNILKQQLSAILGGQCQNSFQKLQAVIKEFGQRRRTLNAKDIEELQGITEGRPWIPVWIRTDARLVKTSHAVLSLPLESAGFYEPAFGHAAEREFLAVMGCAQSPTFAAILETMAELSKLPPALNHSKVTIDLLKILPSKLDDHELAQVFLPDTTWQLRPHKQLCYNDLGPRALTSTPLNQHFFTHPLVYEDLAKRLKVTRLSVHSLPIQDLELDLGQTTLTTIRNTLRQYTYRQLMTEFLANAADAKATEFSVLLDEQPSSSERLLSSFLQPFNNCPALIIHNNQTFSEADFRGICRIGIGGKQHSEDTIGHFGLGAMTMFYLTEAPMVVSSDRVLFLDPSKQHLPVDRAALLLPLDQVKRTYPDHLSSIDGLFGFDITPDTGPYHGTIFIMPLRDQTQCRGREVVDSSYMWSPDKVVREVLETFEELAHKCFLFTKLERIETFHRNNRGLRQVRTSLTASRTELLSDNCEDSLVVTITNGGTLKRSQKWRVVNRVVPKEAWPNNISSLVTQYRLRLPPRVGLAALIDHKNKKFKDESVISAGLFSTLPLPLSISLPVHVTASFILSPDRRNIRLDDYNNAESNYNRWLLNSVLPPAYMYLLELLSHEGDNDIWWPCRYGAHRDPIADGIINSFYHVHLKASNRRVFRSVYNHSTPSDSRQLLPSEAVILRDETPEIVSKLFKLTKPTTVVKPPLLVQTYAIKAECVAVVDRIFARLEVLRFPTIALHLKVKELHDLALYLVKDDAQILVGLPLLPLADGTFVRFELQPAPQMYYIWTSSCTGGSLFHKNYLVHPDFQANDMLKFNFNVAPISSEVVKLYLQEIQKILPVARRTFTQSPEVEAWVRLFWQEFYTLNTSVEELSSFPIIPTKREVYVSLDSCKHSVIITTRQDKHWLWSCFESLGIPVVYRDQQPTPDPIQAILKARSDNLYFQVEHFLSCLEPQIHQNQYPIKFAEQLLTIEAKARDDFLLWIRSNLASTPKSHVHIARKLPVWPASRRQTESLSPSLHPACDVIMLPPSIDLDARRFLDDFVVEYSFSLTKINVEPLTIPQFRSKLQLPTILKPTDRQPYKNILHAIMSYFVHLPHLRPSSLLVPNFNEVMSNSDKLYTRDPLFSAAFGNDSQYFISDSFRDLEPQLSIYGINEQENLDANMFFECASAFDNSLSMRETNRLARARIVYQIYSEDLPLRISAQDAYSWRRFDKLKFIPRRSTLGPQMRGLLDVSRFVHAPDDNITSPDQLVRTEFEAIAWTQRHFFEVQPLERIKIAYPALGVPTFQEVVNHLKVLVSKVAKDHPENPDVLRDIKATYKWLNDRIVEGKGTDEEPTLKNSIYQLHLEQVFLNVDDPIQELWHWESASKLVFDDYDFEGKAYYVRQFLLSYKELLDAANVGTIVQPEAPVIKPTPDSELLTKMRSTYSEMRDGELLTDVEFPYDDGEKPLLAHRTFLAAVNSHFKAIFLGGGLESRILSGQSRVSFPLDPETMPRQAVACILGYAYTGGTEGLEKKDLNDLLHVFKLAHQWEFSEFQDVVQNHIIAERHINPDTYNIIRDVAKLLGATALVNVCDKYEKDNCVVIERWESGY